MNSQGKTRRVFSVLVACLLLAGAAMAADNNGEWCKETGWQNPPTYTKACGAPADFCPGTCYYQSWETGCACATESPDYNCYLDTNPQHDRHPEIWESKTNCVLTNAGSCIANPAFSDWADTGVQNATVSLQTCGDTTPDQLKCPNMVACPLTRPTG